MASVEAQYENGVLRPPKPLSLQPGERVHITIKRQPDAARWNLEQLAKVSDEDVELASAGIADWAQALKNEDDP